MTAFMPVNSAAVAVAVEAAAVAATAPATADADAERMLKDATRTSHTATQQHG